MVVNDNAFYLNKRVIVNVLREQASLLRGQVQGKGGVATMRP
jgi:hypothetical protein